MQKINVMSSSQYKRLELWELEDKISILNHRMRKSLSKKWYQIKYTYMKKECNENTNRKKKQLISHFLRLDSQQPWLSRIWLKSRKKQKISS